MKMPLTILRSASISLVGALVLAACGDKAPKGADSGTGDGGDTDSGATTDTTDTDTDTADSGGGDTGGADDLPCQPERVDLGAEDAAAAWIGAAELALAGEHLRMVGDLDGDGVDDLAIGARSMGDDAGPGDVHLVYGGDGLTGGSVTSLPTLTGERPGDDLGFSVAGIGDIDGDGVDDMAATARYADENAGRVYLVFGGERRTGRTSLADADGVRAISGVAERGQAGVGLSGGFDHDGDGRADMLIGVPFHRSEEVPLGAVALVYGQDDRSALPVSVGDTPGFLGITDGGHLGTRAALGGGDLDGDGFDELAMGAADARKDRAGQVYLWSGQETRRTAVGRSVGEADVVLSGVDSGDGSRFGFGVDLGGDFDGDGYTDLVIGSYYDDIDGPEAGRLWLWRGATDFMATVGSVDDAVLEVRGAEDSERLGRMVRLTGDVDADGDAELLVGRIGIDTPDVDVGSVMLFYGCPELVGVVDMNGAAAHWRGTEAHEYFGYALDLGDLTGDGFADVVIGAPGWGRSTGQVTLYPAGSF